MLTVLWMPLAHWVYDLGSNLADINVFTSGGNDLYLRLSASEFNQGEAASDKKAALASFSIIVLAGLFLIKCITVLFREFKKGGKEFSPPTRNQGVGAISDVIDIHGEGKEDGCHEIPFVSFSTILAATEGFSRSNLLGREGFGPLLQKPSKKEQLDWKIRYSIIEGIARGLLYLHRDSMLRIIHRDLKASNILLDEEMNPKNSDFELARMFGSNNNETTTKQWLIVTRICIARFVLCEIKYLHPLIF